MTPSPSDHEHDEKLAAPQGISWADRRRRWLHELDVEVKNECSRQLQKTAAVPSRLTNQSLVAATIGPLANVFSIAAYVTSWRMRLDVGQDGARVPELMGQTFGDPRWCLDVNIASLACGFLGNLFLLANFTNRIRYIVALPMTIVLWYLSTGMLIAITVGMNVYVPPARPAETYSQGFWYAVLAAVLYLVCSMLLMLNMLGYFLGHYPQQFSLTDAQRTLILQTMMFFIWLAGGAGVFSLVADRHGEPGWTFVDALYFCDVTILTVGFGDLYSQNDVGRGLVFPYSVGGIIMLGLVISSISRFVGEISHDKILKRRAEAKRSRTVERSQTKDLPVPMPVSDADGKNESTVCARHTDSFRTVTISEPIGRPDQPLMNALRRTGAIAMLRPARRSFRPRALILRQEKDRFEAMRGIQDSMRAFKQWTALGSSIVVFSMLWCIGAAVFFVTEASTQGLTYFEALYFCYVSLLTIGYGDLAPKSNAGRPFFVVWSLLAVPTMTILVSTLGDTVINRFKSATSKLADFTILPQYGIWAELFGKVQARRQRRAAERRVEAGFEVGPDPSDDPDSATHRATPTLEQLAADRGPKNEHELARALASAIRRTAHDLRADHHKRYSYEEWVELTELIRFSARTGGAHDAELDGDHSLIEWDWIGSDSPMMADQSEPEFVLDRLCESMGRYVRRRAAPVQPSAAAVDRDRREADRIAQAVDEKGTPDERQ